MTLQNATGGEVRWAVAGDLAIHHWEDEAVVHHAAGNDTHRLGGQAVWVLETLLAGGPSSASELGERAGLVPDAQGLDADLLLLERLHLVARC